MRILYDIFFLLFSLVYLPTLIFKGKAHKDLGQRLGILPKVFERLRKPVWIHGVSVGEASVAVRLASEIKKRYPSAPVVISTTTRTGNDMAHRSGAGLVDAIFYFPLDLTAVVSRVVSKIDPRLYVMVETELWPNLLEELSLRKVPVAMVNGRISDRSFGGYMKLRPFVKRILSCVDLFCMQTKRDAERIGLLGADGPKISVTGNMKFDERMLKEESPRLERAYFGFGDDSEVIVAGSTHFPEEEAVIDIYTRLRAARPELKLVLVPRHVERSGAVSIYIEKSGLNYAKFSDISAGKDPAGADVILVDAIGHLKDIYGIATVVFVGGSLAKKGGQNPIEAASKGKPIVFGPNMFNFREVAELFLEKDAAVQVRDSAELGVVLLELLEDPAERDKMGLAAREVIQENAGAVERTAEALGRYIGK